MTDQELNARFDSLRAEIKTEIKAEGETTRRHFDVVGEGLRAEIRVIAEGHTALRDDVAELKAGQSRLEGRQERLEIRQLALEHRQGRLEEGQGKLEDRVGELERGQVAFRESQQDLIDGQRVLVAEVRQLSARLS